MAGYLRHINLLTSSHKFLANFLSKQLNLSEAWYRTSPHGIHTSFFCGHTQIVVSQKTSESCSKHNPHCKKFIMNDVYDLELPLDVTDLSYGRDNSVVNITLSVNAAYLKGINNRCKTSNSFAQYPNTSSVSGVDFKLINSPIKGLSHLFMADFESNDAGCLLPQSSYFTNIDHVLVAVEPGLMDQTAAFYSDKLGFEKLPMGDTESDPEDIVVHASEGEGLRMKAMDYTQCSTLCFSGKDNLKAKFVLADSLNPSSPDQISNFIKNNNNHSGVQHIALHTEDIVSTCEDLKMAGIKFLNMPKSYYKDQIWRKSVDSLGFDPNVLEENNLLLDYKFDESAECGKGFLLQTFTEPLFPSENTIFLEIIQRCGSKGFGENNIRSLWSAVRYSHSKKAGAAL